MVCARTFRACSYVCERDFSFIHCMSILLFLAAQLNLSYMQHSHATATWLHHHRLSHTLYLINWKRSRRVVLFCACMCVRVCVFACVLAFAFRSIFISFCMCVRVRVRALVRIHYTSICIISVFISIFFSLSKYTWHENSNRSNKNEKTNNKTSFRML